MRRYTAVLATLICSAGYVGAPVQHWTETSTETIWRGRFSNCDHGYVVDLPPGVVAHGGPPPNPNHGFLISAGEPKTTAEVTLENSRLVGVYDQSDATDLGSARAYLDWELKDVSRKVLLIRRVVFRGLPAVDALYEVNAGDSKEVRKELIAYRYRRPGSIYVLWLRTTAKHYEVDSALFARIRAGFRVLPAPKGECSNQ